MNVFRLCGDLSHLLAICILLVKIWRTRSCAGEEEGWVPETEGEVQVESVPEIEEGVYVECACHLMHLCILCHDC